MRCFTTAPLRPSPGRRAVCSLAALALGVSMATGQVERYRLTVHNTWSTASHPGRFPADAHFSHLGGATHGPAVDFWSVGSLAGPGMVRMAETGAVDLLAAEVGLAVNNRTAYESLSWRHWFCPAETGAAQCGPLVVEFDLDAAFPLVTLVTMLGPSPDWFVGVDGLPLHDGARFVDRAVVDLLPYDGGTRSDNVFALGGTPTVPPAPISAITAASGQLIGPQSLGTFVFERVAALAAVTARNGAGSNPLALTSQQLPILGASWSAQVAIPSTGPATLATLLGVSVAGADPGSALFGGELLVVPPVDLLFGLGAHQLTIPASPVLAGLEVFTQGLRLEQAGGGVVAFVLTNALDLVLGY